MHRGYSGCGQWWLWPLQWIWLEKGASTATATLCGWRCFGLLGVGLLPVPGAAQSQERSRRAACIGGDRKWMSQWEVAKKGLWDHLRGLGIESSLQEPMLVHMGFELERLSAHEVADVASQDVSSRLTCPIGLLAMRVFLTGASLAERTDPDNQWWLSTLFGEAADMNLEDVFLSHWPLFGLFRRTVEQYIQLTGYTDDRQDAAVQAKGEANRLSELPVGVLLSSAKDAFSVAAGTAPNTLHDSLPVLAALAGKQEAQLEDEALQRHTGKSPAALYFLRHLRSEFAGFSGAVAPFVRQMLGGSTALLGRSPVCWDIGAAPVENQEWQPAVAEVWSLCEGLGGEVRAFEPSAAGHALLSASLGDRVERLALADFTGISSLVGAGRSTGSLGYRGCGLWVTEAECRSGAASEVVNVTTIDNLIGATGQIDLLKIDVEGAEWQVLRGAERSLKAGRIGMVVLEYGDKWSRDTSIAAKKYARPADVQIEPSLRGVTRWMHKRGYEPYLIGTRTLIPIGEAHWHDVFEACWAPHSLHYHGIGVICWLDVAFAHAGHPFAVPLKELVNWELINAELEKQT
eukprot:TRINITY_DN36295_c0_g1_i2.p1 TRINITY_DN36295_c0_g1~~TRINITY_DN36295_c0_g1_i2.p1  ORF type:complete len:574 (+),score=70.60 TRINITY_DN36295_c0_g1_i2:283-2004(+)